MPNFDRIQELRHEIDAVRCEFVGYMSGFVRDAEPGDPITIEAPHIEQLQGYLTEIEQLRGDITEELDR